MKANAKSCVKSALVRGMGLAGGTLALLPSIRSVPSTRTLPGTGSFTRPRSPWPGQARVPTSPEASHGPAWVPPPLCSAAPPPTPTRRLQKHLPCLPPCHPDTHTPTLSSPGAEFVPQTNPLFAHLAQFPPFTFPSAPTRKAQHILQSPSQKRLLHRAFLNAASEPASDGFLFSLNP